MSCVCIGCVEKRREGPLCWISSSIDELNACRDELVEKVPDEFADVIAKLSAEIDRRNVARNESGLDLADSPARKTGGL